MMCELVQNFHNWLIFVRASMDEIELEQLELDFNLFGEGLNEGVFKEYFTNIVTHPDFPPLDYNDPVINAVGRLIQIYYKG